jgi:hypothetical protein
VAGSRLGSDARFAVSVRCRFIVLRFLQILKFELTVLRTEFGLPSFAGVSADRLFEQFPDQKCVQIVVFTAAWTTGDSGQH